MGSCRYYQGCHSFQKSQLILFVVFNCVPFLEDRGTRQCEIKISDYFNDQISEEEISFLTNGGDPYDDAVVRKLFHPNLRLLLVTEGPDGCRYYTKVGFLNILFYSFPLHGSRSLTPYACMRMRTCICI